MRSTQPETVIAIAVDEGGRGPRKPTELDDYTLSMDDEYVLAYYALLRKFK